MSVDNNSFPDSRSLAYSHAGRVILNLTQHYPTEDQLADGVIPLAAEVQELLNILLTFKSLPTEADIDQRAKAIVSLIVAQDYYPKFRWKPLAASIGGAPYLIPRLVTKLKLVGIAPLFAYSERVIVSETQADGTVVKTSVFQHKGWVPA